MNACHGSREHLLARANESQQRAPDDVRRHNIGASLEATPASDSLASQGEGHAGWHHPTTVVEPYVESTHPHAASRVRLPRSCHAVPSVDGGAGSARSWFGRAAAGRAIAECLRRQTGCGVFYVQNDGRVSGPPPRVDAEELRAELRRLPPSATRASCARRAQGSTLGRGR